MVTGEKTRKRASRKAPEEIRCALTPSRTQHLSHVFMVRYERGVFIYGRLMDRASFLPEIPLPQRKLSVAEAAHLAPGADHYRAFVGPPDRYDFIGATQFALLCTLGLRDRHRVLDFGCGSLRLGRLLIPFLQPHLYHGIEPASWLIEEGLDRELGRDAVRIKQPKFSNDDDFNCGIFGERFDFVIAQSIVTHCGPDLFARLCESVASVLSPDGLFAFSYYDVPPHERPADGWHYPHCVPYDETAVERFVGEAGLVGRRIPWFHPGAQWYVAALDDKRLPASDEMQFLTGAVLHDPQFAASKLPRV